MKLFVVFLLVVFSSCSKLDFAYDLAPRFVMNNLDENFDFSSERYNQIRNSLMLDFKNNKAALKTEFLTAVDKMIVLSEKKDLSAAEIKQFVTDVKSAQKKLIFLFQISFAEVTNGLTAEEFARMKKKSAERHEKIMQRLDDKVKFKEKALDDFATNMERFFDSVTAEQKKIYESYLDENFEFYKEQFLFRKNAIEQFESRLEKKSDLLDYALKFYTADDSLKSADLLKKQEVYFNNTYTVANKIWLTLTSDQRQELKSMLVDLKSEISELKSP